MTSSTYTYIAGGVAAALLLGGFIKTTATSNTDHPNTNSPTSAVVRPVEHATTTSQATSEARAAVQIERAQTQLAATLMTRVMSPRVTARESAAEDLLASLRGENGALLEDALIAQINGADARWQIPAVRAAGMAKITAATDAIARVAGSSTGDLLDECVTALTEIRPDACRAYAPPMLASPSPISRAIAVRAIGAFIAERRMSDDVNLVARLLPLLADPDQGVRDALVQVATSVFTADDLPMLEAKLEDSEPVARLTAARVLLAHTGGGDAAAQLLDDSEEMVRVEATRLIAQARALDAVPALCALAGDPSETRFVRGAAIEAIHELNNPSLSEGLLPLLDDPDPAIRGLAARTLARDKHAAALSTLIEVMVTPVTPLDAELVIDAEDALALAELADSTLATISGRSYRDKHTSEVVQPVPLPEIPGLVFELDADDRFLSAEELEACAQPLTAAEIADPNPDLTVILRQAGFVPPPPTTRTVIDWQSIQLEWRRWVETFTAQNSGWASFDRDAVKFMPWGMH